MHKCNQKPGSLKFGIDNILQQTEHCDQVQAKTVRKNAIMTFPHYADGPAHSVYQHSSNPTIDHFYGRSLPSLHQQQILSPSAGFDFFWNSPNFTLYNTGNSLYGSSSRCGQDIPSIVQRVPLAVSYRKTDPPSDLSKACLTQHTAPRQGKRKKTWTRAVFSSLQRKGLERSFFAQQYISKKDRRKLAATLGLSDSQVRIWYANRRMKNKKTCKNDCLS